MIYLIECTNCNKRYIGQTSQKLKDRLNQHRSNIITDQTTTVAQHFTQQCPNINNLRIIPIESVRQQIPHSYMFMGLDAKCDRLALLRREDFWIRKLNTPTPNGLNIRQELRPPIPFNIRFCDLAPEISKLVKSIYSIIQEVEFGTFRRRQLIISYNRNRNLKDLLVSAKLKE